MKHLYFLSIALLSIGTAVAYSKTNLNEKGPLKMNVDVALIEKVLDVKADVFPEEGVVKVNFPRKDIKIQLSGQIMDPFMGFTSWVAFQQGGKKGIESMAMGDLVLFEDEVNKVMDTAFQNNIEVTALHNHFFFDCPKVYFMHINSEGATKAIAEGIQKIAETVSAIRAQNPKPSLLLEGSKISEKNSIDGKPIEKILGVSGQAKDGMFKVVIGRKIQAGCGCTIGKNMGINTWAAFAGANDNAFVDGDFAVLEEELQPVLKALRRAHINIVAIHNHMTFEKPRMIFLHYMGRGKTTDLAQGLRNALMQTKDFKNEQFKKL
jgi:hypothetical protein